MKRIYATVLLLLLISPTSPAGVLLQEKPSKVFSDLQECVDEAGKQFKEGEGKTLIAGVESSVKAIKGKWRAARNKDVPEDYLKSLRLDCELLNQAARESDREKALEILRDVGDDLKIKERFSRSAMAAAEILGAEVTVTIRTKRAGREVGGYLVRLNPKRYADNQAPMFVFNNPTSPTSRKLPPGNYKLWLEDGNSAVIKTIPVTIGDGDDPEEDITMDVP